MSAWSALVAEALDLPASAPAAPARAGRGRPVVSGLSVRPGEVTARVRGGGSDGGEGSPAGDVHEASLIRTAAPEPEWERVCAALASQPVFRARILAGELPVAAARVFALLGWDLVPAGWDAVVATCSCEEWRSRCAHLDAVAAALGAQADRDPFALTRWLGRDRRALVAQVRAYSPGSTQGLSAEEETFRHNPESREGEGPDPAPSSSPEDGARASGAAPRTAPDADPASAAVFWSAPATPVPAGPPGGAGERVRASAPGLVADALPRFDALGG